jgi:hypothetical protein
VSGKNSDPYRHIISLYVDDIQEYNNAVRNFNNLLINDEPALMCVAIPGEERWAGSFSDVEGNCVQMMQMTGK